MVVSSSIVHAGPASGRQRQRLEFLPGCAKSAKLIDRCASRQERERVEWLGQHLVQIGFRSDADRHMRIEALARRDRNEVGDVLDQGFLNVASAIFAEERRRSPGVHGVGLDGFDEFIL